LLVARHEGGQDIELVKIASLYVFDGLARGLKSFAAQSIYRRLDASGDNAEANAEWCAFMADKIRGIASRVENKATYPGSQLGNSLKLVAKLIGGGLPLESFMFRRAAMIRTPTKLALTSGCSKILGRP